MAIIDPGSCTKVVTTKLTRTATVQTSASRSTHIRAPVLDRIRRWPAGDKGKDDKGDGAPDGGDGGEAKTRRQDHGDG
jgi:hypothetical protein